MGYKTYTDGLTIKAPTAGTQSYASTLDTDLFQDISAHDHTGSPKGVQIGSGAIATNAVTTVKILNANVTPAKLSLPYFWICVKADSNLSSSEYNIFDQANYAAWSADKLESGISVSTGGVITLGSAAGAYLVNLHLEAGGGAAGDCKILIKNVSGVTGGTIAETIENSSSTGHYGIGTILVAGASATFTVNVDPVGSQPVLNGTTLTIVQIA